MADSIAWRSAGEYSDILYDKAEGIAKITMNRPEVLNAFRPQTLDQMQEAFEDAHLDPEIGVVLPTGAADRGFRHGGGERAHRGPQAQNQGLDLGGGECVPHALSSGRSQSARRWRAPRCW